MVCSVSKPKRTLLLISIVDGLNQKIAAKVHLDPWYSEQIVPAILSIASGSYESSPNVREKMCQG